MKKLTAWVCILMSLLGLAACGGPAESEEAAVGGDLLPQIMVEGVLYGDTGTESLLTDRRSGFDGEITSQVDQSQLPTENDQSNFGTGYGYQFGEKPGTVELCVDGRWWVYATAEAREQILHPEQTDPGQWGLSLETEAVTDSGLTILCRHSGGEDVAELHTGSYYVIQKSMEAGWVDVEYLPQEYDVCWTAEAWAIQQEGTTQWDVNWEWLYGKLPAGDYRIGKEIINFRYSGNYDKGILYGEFTVP